MAVQTHPTHPLCNLRGAQGICLGTKACKKNLECQENKKNNRKNTATFTGQGISTPPPRETVCARACVWMCGCVAWLGVDVVVGVGWVSIRAKLAVSHIDPGGSAAAPARPKRRRLYTPRWRDGIKSGDHQPIVLEGLPDRPGF